MTPRKLSADQLRELEQLYRRALLVLEFMTKKSDLVAAVASDGRAGMEAAYRRQDLRALRMAARDDNEWIMSLAPADREELERLLLNELDVDVEEQRGADRARVGEVLARAGIANDEEYRLLLSRLNEIGSDPRFLEEARRIDELVTAYSVKR
jgi:hypothetical protein